MFVVCVCVSVCVCLCYITAVIIVCSGFASHCPDICFLLFRTFQVIATRKVQGGKLICFSPLRQG